jgi:hypothetical protein
MSRIGETRRWVLCRWQLAAQPGFATKIVVRRALGLKHDTHPTATKVSAPWRVCVLSQHLQFSLGLLNADGFAWEIPFCHDYLTQGFKTNHGLRGKRTDCR